MTEIARLVREMFEMSQSLMDMEQRFDAMRSCGELSKDDTERMDGLMRDAQALVGRFRESTTDEIRENSTEYGLLVARMLCVARSFQDLLKERCSKGDFDRLAGLVGGGA